ncbi:uncharacterized protein LOC115885775 isoform X2 [Sitophilus oryzae]|uniref:Uncharacterized protein LOC115885775 isoform X2 n=1 Tax=Sitophilus oryzae TaxID=7048 RepID=A0A6J2Y9V2_SITOR|nr:uncharacterized protein LOC115885775 isoform X2 [Sitophilus oryzae]
MIKMLSFEVEMFKNGNATSPTEKMDHSLAPSKTLRKKRIDKTSSNNNEMLTTSLSSTEYALHNNNNDIKNERLSPSTPDTFSQSRSGTPSSATHSDTSPALDYPLVGAMTGRNYSDFMRCLAAKYNHTNPNDFFSTTRNGFPPPVDPRFKSSVPSITFPTALLSNLNTTPTLKDADIANKKSDFASSLSPFSGAATAMFPPLIDMSTTQTLLAMVRTAKEAELQGLLKNVKRQDSASPLDLSSAAPPPKRARIKTPSLGSPCNAHPATSPSLQKRSESESPKLQEDISSWTVEDVANFVNGIDICSEYTQNFRDQSIDGSGLPLLTEEHLTNTMGMKLGPALKFRSILAKKLGACNVCLHCTHCHNSSNSSEMIAGNGGHTSDSGGVS